MVDMPIKTNKFLRFRNEVVIFSVLERFAAFMALFENVFRKITGIK